MAKRISRINFVFMSIIVAIGIFLSVCSFKIPFYVNDYASFAGAINLSYDIGEGQTAVFEVKPTSSEVSTLTDEQLIDTVEFVRNVLSMFGASYSQVGLEGENMIRAEIVESSTSESLMNALSDRQEIIIRGEETEEATKYDISAQRIKRCSVSYQQTSSTSSTYSFGVLIEFDDLGKSQYKELTEYVADNGNTVYFYSVDGEQLGSLTEITRAVSTGYTFLPQESIQNETDASMFAVNVMMGSKNVKLDIKENSVSSAYLGYNSLTYVVISLVVAFVIIAIFMIVRYRDLGLLAMFTSLINIVLYLFLLQALPIVTLSISGVIGCVVGFALTVYCHTIVFEKIRSEYAKGKKIPLSFKLGFKNSTLSVVDVSVVVVIASVILYAVGFDILKSFAIPLFIGGILGMFSTLVLTRVFTKWYLPLNSTKASHLSLKKEFANED